MRKLVFDLETDGLLDEVTVIHSLVIKDTETGQVISCTNSAYGHAFPKDHPALTGTNYYSSLEMGLAALAQADVLYGHNIIAYDIPVIRKLYPEWRTKAVLKDTLVIAASRFAHVKDLDYKSAAFPKQLAGRHSLKAWGYRLGEKKIDYEAWCKANGIENPWAKWTPEMQAYCEQDVQTTHRLVQYLGKAGIPPEMLETELGLKKFLVAMERNGWPFDFEKAVQLQGLLSAKRQELEQQLVETFGSWKVSTGMFVPKKDNKKMGYVKGVPIEKFKTVTFNPGSRQHIANRLIELYGWKPEVFTPSGEPQVDETTLKGLSYPPVSLLVEYLTIVKRLGQLVEGKEAWMKALKPNKVTGMQHIHGYINQSGTITHRASHSKPNTGQVPKVGSQYGEECRELWRVPDGWKQIGTDASGLEARCLGHFVAKYDGGAYAKLLLEGDVHSENQISLGLPPGKQAVDEDGQKYRDRAKTWYYAWMFGAGDEKLGKILDPKAPKSRWKAVGKVKKAAFLKASPAIKYLIDAIQKRAQSPGYITGLDGRRVYIRSEHAALNTLIQSAGAVICKRWAFLISEDFHQRYGEPSWDGLWTPLGWIHDELQIAVRPEIAEDAAARCITHIESLTEHFKFRCPLTGEAKTGANWKETH